MNSSPSKNQAYDVFISYRHDTGFYMAEILFTVLVAKGYHVFMDKTMASGKYEDKIIQAIKNTRNFVVVLFPGDIPSCKDPNSWMSKEAQWALDFGVPNIVPVMCDDIKLKPEDEAEFSGSMKAILQNQGTVIHKDYSLDRDLDALCDVFLKYATPSKPKISTLDFFRYHLKEQTSTEVTGVDLAFHSGVPWLEAGERKDLFHASLESNTPWRVLINTVDAAESIAQYMRDETGFYIPFANVNAQWKKIAGRYPGVLEVRECPIPLIHVHHCIHYKDTHTGNEASELQVKYYAYSNFRMDNAFEHILSSYSKYYEVYQNEFKFLWERSKPL